MFFTLGYIWKSYDHSVWLFLRNYSIYSKSSESDSKSEDLRINYWHFLVTFLIVCGTFSLILLPLIRLSGMEIESHKATVRHNMTLVELISLLLSSPSMYLLTTFF